MFRRISGGDVAIYVSFFADDKCQILQQMEVENFDPSSS